MVGIAGSGGGGGGGYNYVQDAQPGDPSEGEEWYDTGANAAYVYDGAAWVEQTVVDHGQLSGISGGDHHSRYTDSEAASAAPVQSVSTYANRFAESNITNITSTTWNVSGIHINRLRLYCGGYGQGDVELTFSNGTTFTKTLGDTNSGSAEIVYDWRSEWHNTTLEEVYIQHEDDGNASASGTTVEITGMQTS